MVVSAHSYWVGSTVTLTIKNSEGWFYIIKASTPEAIRTLCDAHPLIKLTWASAESDRRRNNTPSDPEVIEPELESGSAENTQVIGEETLLALQALDVS